MDNNDIGMASTNRQACASCKHQRKKCSQQCLLSPFFPAENNQQFQAVHKLFGVSNVTKLLKSIPFQERKQAIDSLIWEAQCWESNPILGCLGEYNRIRNEYNRIANELQLLKNQQLQQHEVIAAAAAAAAAAAQTDDAGNMMNNKPLMIDYPYHNNNNGITGGAGAGADTTVVNYNSNNAYLYRNAGLILEQNHQHQHGYGHPSMNVQGQEKRFQTRDSTNGHVICLPTSFDQSHHTFNHQNQSFYYDTRKL